MDKNSYEDIVSLSMIHLLVANEMMSHEAKNHILRYMHKARNYETHPFDLICDFQAYFKLCLENETFDEFKELLYFSRLWNDEKKCAFLKEVLTFGKDVALLEAGVVLNYAAFISSSTNMDQDCTTRILSRETGQPIERIANAIRRFQN